MSFKLDMDGRTEFVSVDHLKQPVLEANFNSCNTTDPVASYPAFPASTSTDTPLTQKGADPPYTSHAGRRVHWPKKLSKTIYIWFYLTYFFLFWSPFTPVMNKTLLCSVCTIVLAACVCEINSLCVLHSSWNIQYFCITVNLWMFSKRKKKFFYELLSSI